VNKNPIISVVMSVYNAEKYLDEAIQSILTQTYKDFEFIIINDGSTDKSLKIIEKYKNQDERILLISRENKGLIASLNEGIEKARGEYIARMDADDISLPSRFEEQIEYMRNENLDICGTSIQLFNENKLYKIWNYPRNNNDIKFILMFMSAFAHPTVIIKRDIFNNIKYEDYKHAEDYKLWCDIAAYGYRMGNVDKVLLKYRYHDEQVSKKNNIEQRNKTFKISEYYLKKIGQEKILNSLNKIRNEADFNELRSLYNDIDIYRKESNVDDKLFLEAARYILKVLSPNSLKLYFVYRNATKNIQKDLKIEFYLLIQSLFSINRESKLYQYLKRFV